MIHGLSGLPRSGSTLLGNVLAQNKAFHISGSSPLVEIQVAVSRVLSTAPEIVSELARDPERYNNYVDAMRAFSDAYYDKPGQLIFDKGRLWTNEAVLMRAIFPESVIIVTVRDPRDIVASIEKQHRKTGIFASHTGTTDFHNMVATVMAPTGTIGVFIKGIEDLLRRNLKNVVYIRYEDFIDSPQRAINEIYFTLNLPVFEHFYTDIVNVAPDVDAVFRNKFPHQGSGTITPDKVSSWRSMVPPVIADQIIQSYPVFCQTFGYN